MSEMIEQVARAICRVTPPLRGQPDNSDAYVEQNWRDHERQARSAILSLRDAPFRERRLQEVAYEQVSLKCGHSASAAVAAWAHAWETMIDEMLGQEHRDTGLMVMGSIDEALK